MLEYLAINLAKNSACSLVDLFTSSSTASADETKPAATCRVSSTSPIKAYPEGDKTDAGNVYGPSIAATLVQVLKQCGDELTRENVMKEAASLHDFTVPMLLPGITINTSPTDFAPINQIRMARFDGERWLLFGPVIRGEANG